MHYRAPHVTRAQWFRAWRDVRQNRSEHELGWFILRHPIAGCLAYVTHTMRTFAASCAFGPVAKLP